MNSNVWFRKVIALNEKIPISKVENLWLDPVIIEAHQDFNINGLDNFKKVKEDEIPFRISSDLAARVRNDSQSIYMHTSGAYFVEKDVDFEMDILASLYRYQRAGVIPGIILNDETYLEFVLPDYFTLDELLAGNPENVLKYHPILTRFINNTLRNGEDWFFISDMNLSGIMLKIEEGRIADIKITDYDGLESLKANSNMLLDHYKTYTDIDLRARIAESNSVFGNALIRISLDRMSFKYLAFEANICRKCDFSNMHLDDSLVSLTIFESCNMQNMDLGDTEMLSVIIRDSDMRNSDLFDIKILGPVILNNVDLRDAEIDISKLNQLELRDVKLSLRHTFALDAYGINYVKKDGYVIVTNKAR